MRTMKVILTKHAQERMSKRTMSKLGVEETVLKPDKKITGDKGETKFIKQQGSRQYQVIATYKPNERAWLVISAWVRGEEDQPDLLWRILTMPFKLLWSLLKILFGTN